jgi:hypothetical protein
VLDLPAPRDRDRIGVIGYREATQDLGYWLGATGWPL